VAPDRELVRVRGGASPRRGSSLPEGDCIFCKIVRGEADATVVNRTDWLPLYLGPHRAKSDVHLLVLRAAHDAFRDICRFLRAEDKTMPIHLRERPPKPGLETTAGDYFSGASAGQLLWHLPFHLLAAYGSGCRCSLEERIDRGEEAMTERDSSVAYALR